MKLVDTSFLIDYAQGDEDAISYLAEHDDEVFGASTIVLSEIYRGLMVTQEMNRQEAMAKYEWVDAIPFKNSTAAEAAEIYVQLRAKGEMINKSDIYVAGTAREIGIPLVTADSDFETIDGLDVEFY